MSKYREYHTDTLAAIENHSIAAEYYHERLKQHLSWLDTESAKADRRDYLYNVVRDEVLEHGEPTERCQRIYRNLEGNRSWYWEAVREGQNRHRWRKRIARLAQTIRDLPTSEGDNG